MGDRMPWVIRWQFNTGYRGEDRFKNAERAVVFCDEMFRRVDPPILELVHFSAVNEDTREGLGDYLRRHRDLTSRAPSVEADLGRIAHLACGTCGGSGRIPIIQTGGTKHCTRCGGTGRE